MTPILPAPRNYRRNPGKDCRSQIRVAIAIGCLDDLMRDRARAQFGCRPTAVNVPAKRRRRILFNILFLINVFDQWTPKQILRGIMFRLRESINAESKGPALGGDQFRSSPSRDPIFDLNAQELRVARRPILKENQKTEQFREFSRPLESFREFFGTPTKLDLISSHHSIRKVDGQSKL
jgi:hypothetical protein